MTIPRGVTHETGWRWLMDWAAQQDAKTSARVMDHRDGHAEVEFQRGRHSAFRELLRLDNAQTE